MDRAARKADNTARKIENAGKAIGKAIGIAFTAAVAAAGAVTVALGKSIDRMDDLSKAAQRASLPTEDFTRFRLCGLAGRCLDGGSHQVLRQAGQGTG